MNENKGYKTTRNDKECPIMNNDNLMKTEVKTMNKHADLKKYLEEALERAKLSKSEIIYISNVPYGKENAITRGELSRKTGFSPRNLTEIRHRLNVKGFPILDDASNGGGLYKPVKREDMKPYMVQEEHAIESRKEALRGVKAFYYHGTGEANE